MPIGEQIATAISRRRYNKRAAMTAPPANGTKEYMVEQAMRSTPSPTDRNLQWPRPKSNYTYTPQTGSKGSYVTKGADLPAVNNHPLMQELFNDRRAGKF